MMSETPIIALPPPQTRDWANVARATWTQQNAHFGHPEKAAALIDHHILRHGPWAPHTVEGALRFLRRTGRKYHLEVKKETVRDAVDA